MFVDIVYDIYLGRIIVVYNVFSNNRFPVNRTTVVFIIHVQCYLILIMLKQKKQMVYTERDLDSIFRRLFARIECVILTNGTNARRALLHADKN